ncbi:hypothetical protein [Pontibacillus salipaludis]|uniref:hypothetical protein n=1 Tax=Pontibacillus salipaludis TaxID=1697394 RepID=UPI0031E71897
MKKITIEEAIKEAEKRKGNCLSNEIINTTTPLKWRCNKGHTWESNLAKIKSGSWCPQCSRANIKLSIEDMHNIAKERNGKFLSPSYINSTTKHNWQCAKGHIFNMRPADIRQRNTWCPQCAGVKKGTIEEMQELAEKHGGKCLSNEYFNLKTPLMWQCRKGHIWEERPAGIKNNKWCPTCTGRTKLTINDMKKLAEDRGGKCLSGEYINLKTPLTWQCANGHVWDAAPSNIKHSKSWCPDCHGHSNEKKCRLIFRELFGKDFPKNRKVLGNKLELDGFCEELKIAFEYQGKQHYEYVPFFHQYSKQKFKERVEVDLKKAKLCREKGIKLIIIPYYKNKSDKALINFIQKEINKLGIEISNDINEGINLNAFYKDFSALQEIKELARSKGGKCLSNEYTDNMSILKFQCNKGHTWETRAITFKHDDTWCPKCARNSRKSIEDMHILAEEHGGKFLSPTFTNVSEYYKWRCADGHIWDAKPSNIQQGSWCPICVGKINKVKFHKNKITIRDMHKLAELHQGKCLSTEYTNLRTPLKWQCAKGHTWDSKPANIQQGSWCPICFVNKRSYKKITEYHQIKITIDDMHELAKERSGKCLSTEYTNTRTPLKWECAEGHIWEAAPRGIKRGTWCPTCAGRVKLTKEDMHTIARERGGKFLSIEYINSDTPLKWECANGHIWEARPSSIIRNKSWCPTCAGNAKLTIEEMHTIAKERGGHCLSEVYINGSTKLEWQCAQGHTWEAKPDNIKWKKSWCPTCSRKKKTQ